MLEPAETPRWTGHGSQSWSGSIGPWWTKMGLVSGPNLSHLARIKRWGGERERVVAVGVVAMVPPGRWAEFCWCATRNREHTYHLAWSSSPGCSVRLYERGSEDLVVTRRPEAVVHTTERSGVAVNQWRACARGRAREGERKESTRWAWHNLAKSDGKVLMEITNAVASTRSDTNQARVRCPQVAVARVLGGQ